jgi:hypothetical protein
MKGCHRLSFVVRPRRSELHQPPYLPPEACCWIALLAAVPLSASIFFFCSTAVVFCSFSLVFAFSALSLAVIAFCLSLSLAATFFWSSAFARFAMQNEVIHGAVFGIAPSLTATRTIVTRICVIATTSMMSTVLRLRVLLQRSASLLSALRFLLTHRQLQPENRQLCCGAMAAAGVSVLP